MIRLTDLLKELQEPYKTFFGKEQEYFTKEPSYDDYVKNMNAILPKDDKSSLWLFNHHAAEIAWEENKVSQAKKHIKTAMQNNVIGNSITFVLDFIINNKGSKEQLQQGIESKIADSTEKKTALELLNDPHYGGKLK